MFDLVLNTPLNTIKKIFPGVSKLKLMTTNFPYQYLPESKAYLEPWSFSANFFFFAKFIRKHLCWSLILIKLQGSIRQFQWKKGLQQRCFLVNFARYLRYLFYRTFPGESLCSTEKIFDPQNSKGPSEKREK